MLRISKQVDYGILLLSCCARGAAADVHNARDLAEATGLPVPMVGKVLKYLARDEILVSHRGTKGGYSLGRAPREITVASIVQALEGPIRLVDCASEETDRCRLRGECDVVAPLRSLAIAVRELFERVTLADLLVDCETHLLSGPGGSERSVPGNGGIPTAGGPASDSESEPKSEFESKR